MYYLLTTVTIDYENYIITIIMLALLLKTFFLFSLSLALSLSLSNYCCSGCLILFDCLTVKVLSSLFCRLAGSTYLCTLDFLRAALGVCWSNAVHIDLYQRSLLYVKQWQWAALIYYVTTVQFTDSSYVAL